MAPKLFLVFVFPNFKDFVMAQILLDSVVYLHGVATNIGKLTLKVFDTNGRIAKKVYHDIMEGVQKLDLSDLADGTYIINAFKGDMFLKAFRVEKQ